jgi:hypothetical protein
MRNACLALGLLLLSAPVWGGDEYSFTLEHHEGLDDKVRKGRVLVEGGRYRLELEPEEEPRPFDVLIVNGPDEPAISLNLADHTYYQAEKKAPGERTLPTFLALWFYSFDPHGKTVSKVRVETRDASEPETVSGLTTHRHETRASYNLAVKYPSETLRGHVTIEEVSWLAEDRSLPVPPLLLLDVTTAFPEVDKPLAEARSRLRGLPVKSQVTVTVDMGRGSALQTFLLASTLHDLKAVTTDDSLFKVPSGFRYEKPPQIVPPSQ